MNPEHLELLASDGWKDALRELILPFAFDDVPIAALGQDVLEIGPGPGLTTDLLAPQLTQLTALELDPALTRELAARYASDPAVTVVEGDGSRMPFEGGRFSGVVSFTMLHHIPDASTQDRLFTEVARVLSPDGLFIASDSVASDDLAALHHGDIYNPIDPDELPERLAAAGLESIVVRSNPFGWAARAHRAS